MMGKVFGMIALACLLAFSFSAYAKEQNCEQECAQACGGKGNVYITIVCRHVPKLAREGALRCRRLSSILGASIYRLLG